MNDKRVDRAWAAAICSLFLFLLGAVGVWAQEYAVWIPRLLTDVLVLAGLALSVTAVVLLGRRLFAAAARPESAWRAVRILLVAGVPPLLFTAWYVWMRTGFAEGL